MSPISQEMSPEYSAGFIAAQLEHVIKANDASEARIHASIESIRTSLEQYTTRREFEALSRTVDKIAVDAREANTTAEDAVTIARSAVSDGRVTNAGMAPWKQFLGLLLAAAVGAAATAMGLN